MIDLDSLDGINIISDTTTTTITTTSTTTTDTITAAANTTNDYHTQHYHHQQHQQLQTADPDNYSNEIDTTATITPEIISTTSSPPSSSVTTSISAAPASMSKRRHTNLLTCMFITANVGTIFEESTLLELWFQQLKCYLIKVKPQLVAIHCQEVGGKNYESSMKNVSNFTDKIIGDETIIKDYSRVRIFLDENFESLEKFTALGSLYLIHDSVDNIKLYNFKTAQYEFVEGKNVLAGNTRSTNNINNNNLSNNINNNNNNINKCNLANDDKESGNIIRSTSTIADHVEKIKFPQELFPECRWSRKGFMRTRWLFNDCQPLDLVNIHLFHDASNLIAMEKTPSPYAQNRQRALQFALDRLLEPLEGTWGPSPSPSHQEQIDNRDVPLFIFGDFNFRLNTSKVIQRITEGVSPVIKRSTESNEVLEFVYHRKNDENKQSEEAQKKNENDDSEPTVKPSNCCSNDGNCNYLEDGSGVIMTIGKKLFDCENLDEMFRATKNTEWLQELDNELDSFRSQLYEFKISFSPSYPFKEDTTGGYSYMKTRCPAWCDRILFNEAGNRMIHSKVDNDIKLNLNSEKRLELLQSQGDVIYRLMGNSVPMGDHKPVLLYCQLNLANRKEVAEQRGEKQNPSSNKCNLSSNESMNESTTMAESTAM